MRANILSSGESTEPSGRCRTYDRESRRGLTANREAYLDNLRIVLDEVAVLLENIDADTVAITTDHGGAFGERNFYRHPVACPLSRVRRVPWVETTAVDTGSIEPSASDPEAVETTSSVESRLEQ